jgi:2-polyprenyl-3-methyl-5-hydroxy-6-metoxy-1,4-benzoquinol methylase
MSKKFTENQSKQFDEFFSAHIGQENNATQYEFDTLLKFMGDIKGKKILDLGCGSGRFGVKLAAAGAESVVGLDLSAVAIEKANLLAKDLSVTNFHAFQKPLNSNEFLNTFDYVLCVNMLHHTSEQDLVLNYIYNSLKDGGALIVLENNSFNPFFIPFFIMIGALKSHLTLQYLKSNKYSLRNMITRSGLKIEKVERYAWLPTMLYNTSSLFIGLNKFLNSIPVINEFSAFHFFKAVR